PSKARQVAYTPKPPSTITTGIISTHHGSCRNVAPKPRCSAVRTPLSAIPPPERRIRLARNLTFEYQIPPIAYNSVRRKTFLLTTCAKILSPERGLPAPGTNLNSGRIGIRGGEEQYRHSDGGRRRARPQSRD